MCQADREDYFHSPRDCLHDPRGVQPGMLMRTSSSDSGFAADLHPRRKSEDRHHTTFARQSQGVCAKIPANFVPIGSRRVGRRFSVSISAAFPAAVQSMCAAYRPTSLSTTIASSAGPLPDHPQPRSLGRSCRAHRDINSACRWHVGQMAPRPLAA